MWYFLNPHIKVLPSLDFGKCTMNIYDIKWENCFNMTDDWQIGKKLALYWARAKGQLNILCWDKLRYTWICLLPNHRSNIKQNIVPYCSYVLGVYLNDTMPLEARYIDLLILRNGWHPPCSVTIFPIITHIMFCFRQWKDSSWGTGNSGISSVNGH